MSEAEPHHHFCYLFVSIFAEGVRLDSSKHSLHPLLLLCLQLTAGAQHPSDWRVQAVCKHPNWGGSSALGEQGENSHLSPFAWRSEAEAQ